MGSIPNTSCPVCGARGPWSNSDTRPFCSIRCKQVDLGKWLSGEYRFSEPLKPSDFDEALEDRDDTAPGYRDNE